MSTQPGGTKQGKVQKKADERQWYDQKSNYLM